MSLRCIKISETIWKHVSEGVELTEETLDHIRSCRCCSDALAEAQARAEGLKRVGPYPTAPDCRSAVMDRVSARRVRLVPKWAYACAAVIASVLVGGAFLTYRGGGPASEQVRMVDKMPGHSPQETPLSVPVVKAPAGEVQISKAMQRPRVHRQSLRHSDSISHERRRSSGNAAPSAGREPADRHPIPDIAPSIADSSALAYVTWSTANHPRDSYKYGYTVTDPATGEVTECSVKREGRSIVVNMKSEPAKLKKRPEKESKSNEAV